MTNFPTGDESQKAPDSVCQAPSVIPEKKTIKEIAGEHTDLAINTLVAVLQKGMDPSKPEEKPASDMARITAATALLDRGHGKPTQYVEQTTKVLTYQDLLSDIAQKEKAWLQVVDADEVKQISWDDIK